jgi:hypothetical protein
LQYLRRYIEYKLKIMRWGWKKWKYKMKD